MPQVGGGHPLRPRAERDGQALRGHRLDDRGGDGDRRAVHVEEAEVGECGDVLTQIRLVPVQRGGACGDGVDHRDETRHVDTAELTGGEPGSGSPEVVGDGVGRGVAHASSCRREMGVDTISRARTTASVSGAL